MGTPDLQLHVNYSPLKKIQKNKKIDELLLHKKGIKGHIKTKERQSHCEPLVNMEGSHQSGASPGGVKG